MTCICNTIEDIVDISDHYSEFIGQLIILETGSWVKLMKCSSCEQLWRVDGWDKGQAIFAIKLSEEKNWLDVDVIYLKKDRLLKSRGGLDNKKKCCWVGCKDLCVQKSVYCLNHLYETGARE